MKKLFLLLFVALISVGASADMVIEKTNGQNVSIALNSIRSIKYNNGSMVVNKTDNSQQTISLNDVKIIVFSDIETAIKTIVGDEVKTLKITDLEGREVNKQDVRKGIYIINGQKVLLK